MSFTPLLHVERFDKQTAAARQVEASIDAFERGDYASAITLSGAAEGMLPEIPEQPLFALMRDDQRRHPALTKREWLSIINAERDWLKHPTDEVLGAVIEIDPNDAAVMILRALAKLPAWSKRMDAFKEWAMGNGFARGSPVKW